MGIPTSRNPDTPEGLVSRLSIGIHRILAELPHSTELELKKPRRKRMDSGRASMLELLRGTPDKLRSPPALPTTMSHRGRCLRSMTLEAYDGRYLFISGCPWACGDPGSLLR
jgi:hypothetical protein